MEVIERFRVASTQAFRSAKSEIKEITCDDWPYAGDFTQFPNRVALLLRSCILGFLHPLSITDRRCFEKKELPLRSTLFFL